MSAVSTEPAAFSIPAQPLLPGGGDTFVQNIAQRLQIAIEGLRRMVPHAAIKAPTTPRDGMVRLARRPWWPVSGQAADAWVYYDATGRVWRYLSTAPTQS